MPAPVSPGWVMPCSGHNPPTSAPPPPVALVAEAGLASVCITAARLCPAQLSPGALLSPSHWS